MKMCFALTPSRKLASARLISERSVHRVSPTTERGTEFKEGLRRCLQVWLQSVSSTHTHTLAFRAHRTEIASAIRLRIVSSCVRMCCSRRPSRELVFESEARAFRSCVAFDPYLDRPLPSGQGSGNESMCRLGGQGGLDGHGAARLFACQIVGSGACCARRGACAALPRRRPLRWAQLGGLPPGLRARR